MLIVDLGGDWLFLAFQEVTMIRGKFTLFAARAPAKEIG